MTKKQTWLIYISLVIFGVGIWIAISLLTGNVEAWDSSYYFLYGLPLMCFVSGLLGFIIPIRVWRWGVIMIVSQALFLVSQKPTSNLLPLGLIVFGGLSIPCIVVAYISAFIKNKVKR